MTVVERARPAMGSLFRLRLLGDDADHLEAVAEAALDEIERIERLLSWRDARSEVARINREATARPVLVDFELAAILAQCQEAEAATDGYLDLAAAARAELRETGRLWEFDAERRLIRFTCPGVRLDFGAYGKGYALDCAAAELRSFGITQALLDGGTSSVLALGTDEFGNPWPVGMRNPFAARPDAKTTWPHELGQLRLTDLALSSSAALDAGLSHSADHDMLNPRTGEPIADPSAYTVVAADGATAEVLSTALCAMGSAAAEAYTKERTNDLLAAAVAIVRFDPPQDADGSPHLTPLLVRRPGVLV
ncbi:MAG: FAD:protein FMN transferase [Planctomycetales bacterium]|nr:FAD:protein FMN transferase [Planctomycetales bacterium]MBN8627204.1 FAD:protein FMN transferase [Planctomycetota bacterium]